ncbi:MAG: DinB family protein [Vicinamibacterales bacterium]
MLAGLETLFTRDLACFVREVELCPDDERLWQVVPGITNSVGNLGLHVAGNLQHFVGAVLGGTGYVRRREDEFGRRAGTRAEVVAALEAASGTIRAVLPRVTAEALAAPFPEQPGGHTINTGVFLQHLASHLALHLGQAGYLRRIVTANPASAGPSALAPLAGV